MCYILLKSLFRLIENILRMKKKFSFIIVFLCAVSVWGQTQVKKEQLQKQNAELKKQIEEINKNLAKTKSEAKLSLAYLNEINKKIDLREKVYGNTQKQKRILEDDIYLKQLEINRQEKELKTLRKNYSKVLVKAYKNKGVQNKVTFILSSKNIGEAVRRMQYLKSYSDFQDKKAAEIQGVSNQIKKTIVAKQKSVKDKNELLNTQKKELVTIGEERKEKEKLLEEFRKNEAKLTAEIRQKQKESKLLEAKIRSIIIEEAKIAKAKEEAERKAKEEKIRLAKIAAEKEKARIEAENRKKLEEAAKFYDYIELLPKSTYNELIEKEGTGSLVSYDDVEKMNKYFYDLGKRLGILGNWDNPYITLRPEYEAEQLKVFKEIYENGYIYKGLKPVYWSPTTETALAEAEIEYKDVTSHSIYVKFEGEKDLTDKLGVDEASILIWTTTPWTLPANLGVFLHPEFDYGLYKTEKGNLVVAKDLAEDVFKTLDLSYELLKEFKGTELEYTHYQHPFLDRKGLVMSDYKEYTVLDGTNPTLDASDLSYEEGKIYV